MQEVPDNNVKMRMAAWRNLLLHSFVNDQVFLRKPRARGLCESRGGRPGLPVPNKLDGFCGRKAALKFNETPALLSLGKRQGEHAGQRILASNRACQCVM